MILIVRWVLKGSIRSTSNLERIRKKTLKRRFPNAKFLLTTHFWWDDLAQLISKQKNSKSINERKFIFDNLKPFPKDRVYVDYTRRKPILTIQEENEIIFESRFESGNLWKAIRLGLKDEIL